MSRSIVSRTLVVGMVSAMAVACGPGEPGNALEEVSQLEVIARPQVEGGEIRASSLDYAWMLPGRTEPSVSTRTSRNAVLAAGAEGTLAHDIVDEIARGLRLWPEGAVPYRSLDEEGEVRWTMEFPLSEGVRVSAFIPVRYARDEEGRWSGEGTVARDQRWILADRASPDTVLLRISGSFLDERDEDGGGRLSFVANGTLSIASLGLYDLEISRNTTVNRVTEEDVEGRVEGIEKEMLRLRGDPGS
jgi:hypothetical protein